MDSPRRHGEHGEKRFDEVMARHADPEPFKRGERERFRGWTLALCLDWNVVHREVTGLYRGDARNLHEREWIRVWAPDRNQRQAMWLGQAMMVHLEAGPDEWVARDMVCVNERDLSEAHVAIGATAAEAILKVTMKRWRASL